MPAVLSGREQSQFFDHLSARRELQEAARVAFSNKGAAVREALAGVDLGAGIVGKTQAAIRAEFLHAMSRGEEESAIGEHPEVVAVLGRVVPRHRPGPVDDEDPALRVIGTHEGMGTALLDRPGRGQRNQGEAGQETVEEAHVRRHSIARHDVFLPFAGSRGLPNRILGFLVRPRVGRERQRPSPSCRRQRPGSKSPRRKHASPCH
jgi:hypothetical protein